MSKFKSAIDLIDNGNGSHTLEYSIFLPGRVYSEGTITKTQIDDYDPDSQELAGIVVEIKFEDGGLGNPLTLSGSVAIATPYVISEAKPFVEVVYKAWDTATQMYKDKGGAIVRKILG